MALSPKASGRPSTEEVVYDDAGQPLTASLADYVIPAASARCHR
jgi:CO/xanthine dehydrogenase Mo-binding subunit